MADPVATSLTTGQSVTATTTVNFTAQPAGTLLLLAVIADDYRTGNPSGWTLAYGGPGSGEFHGHYLWYKIASGAETSVAYTIGSGVRSVYALAKVTEIDGTTPLDIAASGQSVNSSGTSYTTPTSGTTTSGRRIAIAMIAGSNSGSLPTGIGTWLNSYAAINSSVSTVNPGLVVGLAGLVFNGGGTTSSGATYTTPWTAQSRSGIIAVFRNAAGGSTVTVNLADTLGITDSITRVATANRAAADALGITDTGSEQVLVIELTLEDAAGLTDVVARTMTLPRALTDLSNLSDVVAAITAATRAPADAAGLTDLVTSALTLPRLTVDVLGISDALTVATQTPRAAADAEALTDAIAATVSATRVMDDDAGLTDTISSSASVPRTPGDVAGATDELTVTVDATRAAADVEGMTDALHVEFSGSGSVTVGDVLGLGDVLVANTTAVRPQADAEGLSDGLSISLTTPRSPADTVALTDVLAPTVSATRVLVDSLGMTDGIAVELIGPTGVTSEDDLVMSDAITVVMHRVITVADFLGAIDAIIVTQSGADDGVPVDNPQLVLTTEQPTLQMEMTWPQLSL